MSGGLGGFSALARTAEQHEGDVLRMRLLADIYMTWMNEGRPGFAEISRQITTHQNHARFERNFQDGTRITYHVLNEHQDDFDGRRIETIALSAMTGGAAVYEEVERRLGRGQDMTAFVGGTLSGSRAVSGVARALHAGPNPPGTVAGMMTGGPSTEEWNTIQVAMMNCLLAGRIRIVGIPAEERPTPWACQMLPGEECDKNSDGALLPGYRVGPLTSQLFLKLQQAVQAAAASQEQQKRERTSAAARRSIRRPIRRIIGESDD